MSHKFLEIVHNRSIKGQTLKRVYRKLKDRELLLLAYGKLYAKKGATTPGIDPTDTVDGMSLRRIDKISADLATGNYQWKPVRRKEIAKRNGKTRALGLPSWSDKLVQEAMRLVLEAYYEPKFSEYSHAYRPERGCHTALQQIKRGWKGVKWFIKIDIKGCFDNIDHDVTLDIIFRDIQDVRFRKLLKQMLQAGYMKGWEYHRTYSGTPQGGVVSPILSNIVLNELDQFVENELIPAYTKGKRRRNNPEYRHYSYLIQQAKQANDKDTHARLVAERRQIPSRDTNDPSFRRLKYARYADDILLGFIGPKSEAVEIKAKIQEFLNRMKLEASAEKSQIIHSRKQVRFLNYHIHMAHNDTKLTENTQGIKVRSVNCQLILTVPYEVRQQWLKRYSRNGKAVHRVNLLHNTDFEIVKTYDLQLRGLINYYALASNVGKLSQVKYHLEQSLVKTLAAKHKTRKSKIYQKYNQPGQHTKRCLTVRVDNPNNPDKPYVATFGDIPIRQKKETIIVDEFQVITKGPNELIQRLLANECELCGSHEEIEVHHIRALKDIKRKYKNKGKTPPRWAMVMIERNRKTLVVCHECHTAIHNGTYDGQKVN